MGLVPHHCAKLRLIRSGRSFLIIRQLLLQLIMLNNALDKPKTSQHKSWQVLVLRPCRISTKPVMLLLVATALLVTRLHSSKVTLSQCWYSLFIVWMTSSWNYIIDFFLSFYLQFLVLFFYVLWLCRNIHILVWKHYIGRQSRNISAVFWIFCG